MKRLRILSMMFLTSYLFLGCSTTQTLTLVSTKNVDLSAQHDVTARAEEKSEGRFWLLFIPFASEPNEMRAAKKLLDEHDGDYLTNVEVTNTGWSILLFSWGSVTIKGDVYQRVNPTTATPSAAAVETPAETPSK